MNRNRNDINRLEGGRVEELIIEEELMYLAWIRRLEERQPVKVVSVRFGSVQGVVVVWKRNN